MEADIEASALSLLLPSPRSVCPHDESSSNGELMDEDDHESEDAWSDNISLAPSSEVLRDLMGSSHPARRSAGWAVRFLRDARSSPNPSARWVGAGVRRGAHQFQQETVPHHDEVSDEGILDETGESAQSAAAASDDWELQFEATDGGTVGAADIALRRGCFAKGIVLSVPVMVVLRSVVRALTALKRDLLNLLASALGVDMGKRLLLRVAAAISSVSAASVKRAREIDEKKLEARLDRHNAAKAAALASRAPRDRGVRSRGCHPRPSDADRRTAMKNIIRTAIAAAVEGDSFFGYERMLHRMRLASAQVGHRYEDRKFAARILQMAGLVMKQLDAHDLQSRLPGIGIPSDFAVLADAVTMGLQIFTKHDTLNVMCLCVVGCGGKIHCPFFDAPAMALGSHRGQNMCSLMLKTLEEHPVTFGVRVLRQRLSSVCGDGAMTIGGPDHRHNSNKAAELLWQTVHAELKGQVPDMTVWDAFHRVDVAMWRAVKKVPLSKAVFDTAKRLDQLFCRGEGLLVYRGTVAAMSMNATSIRAPSGTRKVGYLAGTPGSVLQNYKAVICSVHARLELVRGKQSVQTLTHLADICRVLTDVSFIAFSAFFDDLLRDTLHPFSTQVQKAIEPAVFARAERRIMGRLRDLPDKLRYVRRLLRVISLLRQWLSASELKTLWLAHLSSRAGLLLPNFWRAVAEILATATPCYQGVELASAEFLDPNISHCLGPHCQCPGRISAGPASSRVPTLVRGERRLVPPWVAHGGRLRPYDGDYVGVSARWQKWAVGSAVGRGLRDVLRKKRGDCAACHVPHSFFITHDSLDGALKAATKVVVELHTELHHILGSVGVNDGMASLLHDASKCFDWGSLATKPPSADDVRAFGAVAKVMEPLMHLTEYPVHEDFQEVSRTWPTQDELCGQYMVLCRRVRAVYAAAKLNHGHGGVPKNIRPPPEVVQAARRWSKVVACKVSPVWSRGVLRHVLGICLARASMGPVRTRTAVLYEVCTLVCLFEGLVPKEAFKTYRVSVNSLLFATKLTKQRHLAIKVWRDSDLDDRSENGRKRRLVRVIADETEVDISAVSAAIDMHSWFSVGRRGDVREQGGRQYLCWHVARLHHRSRLMAPPDAACESIGSQIRWLWDQRGGSISPTLFADKVHLAAAGVSCLGGDRDETIVECVLRMLEKGSLKKLTPFEGDRPDRRRRTTRGGHAAGKLTLLRDSARSHIAVDENHIEGLSVSLWDEAAPGLEAHHKELAARARAGWPTELPQALTDALSRVTRGTRVPTVLPSVDLMRVDMRDVAVSVRNHARTAWFTSDGYQEWAIQRRRLLHHDEPDAVINAMGSRVIAGAVGDTSGSSDPEGVSGSSDAEAATPSKGTVVRGAGVDGRGRGRGDAASGGRGRGRARGRDAASGGRGRGRGAAGDKDVRGGTAAGSAASPAASSASIGGALAEAAAKKRRR